MTSARRRMARLRQTLSADRQAQRQIDQLAYSIGALHAVSARRALDMKEAEFKCYSQFGEDGIIQWLIARVPIVREHFVEFGVADYAESNTRFLLEHDDWHGLILDASDAHVQFLAQGDLLWRHSIEAKQAFITRENINELLASSAGDIGLLSVDLDGNDYWIWEAISIVDPRIVIVEFNSLFGPSREVSVPYDPAFDRTEAHYSWLYWGASLPAMARLGHEKGYRLVGTNRAGHNAFFVRDDVAGDLRSVSAEEAWRESRYRELRAEDGTLSYVTERSDRLALVADMPLTDVATGQTLRVGDL